MPADAVLGWRIIRPSENEKQRVQSWRFFNKDGAEIDTSKLTLTPADYDPRTRSWFTTAQGKGRTSLSKVYVFSSLQQPGVTISSPMQNFDNATVGVDLPSAELADLTKRLSPGKGGVVAIIDADGGMVAHPEPKKNLRKLPDGATSSIVSISKIDDNRLRIAYETAQTTKNQHFTFRANGEEYIADFKAIGDNATADWHIISIAAVSDFTEKLVSGLERSTIFAVGALIIAVFGVTVLAGWIAAPIIRLRDHADRVTDMDLTPLVKTATPFREIQSLQNSVERMRNALDTFLRYVPRDLVYNLVRTGQAARIGGSNCEMTVLFTDIEGFTTISESLTPEQILDQTSTYFEQMSFAIQSSMGTIDKFIGDAIMAMWNAPREDEHHVENAYRGTLAAL
jgi:adenylate cyclase